MDPPENHALPLQDSDSESESASESDIAWYSSSYDSESDGEPQEKKARISINTTSRFQPNPDASSLETFQRCFRQWEAHDIEEYVDDEYTYEVFKATKVYDLRVPLDEFRDMFTFDTFRSCLASSDNVRVAPQIFLCFEEPDIPQLHIDVDGIGLYVYTYGEAPSGRMQSVVDAVLHILSSPETRQRKRIYISGRDDDVMLPASALALSKLIQTKSAVETLVFRYFRFGTDLCAALGAVSPASNNFCLEMINCTMEDVAAFGTGLSENHGPHGLIVRLTGDLWTPSSLPLIPILSSLGNNSQLSHLEYHVCENMVFAPPLDEAGMKVVESSLAKNTGLTALVLKGLLTTPPGYAQFCRTLAYHQNLVHLSLSDYALFGPINFRRRPEDANRPDPKVVSRLDNLVDMLRVNFVLERLDLDATFYSTDIWRYQVAPMVKRNVFAKRFAAVSKTNDEHFRKALMAKALLHVSRQPHLLYLGLQGSLSPLILEE